MFTARKRNERGKEGWTDGRVEERMEEKEKKKHGKKEDAFVSKKVDTWNEIINLTFPFFKNPFSGTVPYGGISPKNANQQICCKMGCRTSL